MVKRLRHRPFTAVTRVRFPFGSPKDGHVAQLVRAPASHAGGRWFESISLHQVNGLRFLNDFVEKRSSSFLKATEKHIDAVTRIYDAIHTAEENGDAVIG